MELDTIVGLLLEARKAASEDPAKSGELSLVLTKIDESLLWRHEDIRVKDAKPKGGA